MKNNPASLFVVPLEKDLVGFPHFGVVDIWPSNSKVSSL